MTLLPSIDLTRDAVILRLDDGQRHVLRTVTQVRQIRGLLDVAECELEEQQRQRALRLDKDTARAVNAAHAVSNAEFGVLPQVYERPPAVVIDACLCSKFMVCERHMAPDGAA